MMFALISVCISVSGFQKKTVIKNKKKNTKGVACVWVREREGKERVFLA